MITLLLVLLCIFLGGLVRAASGAGVSPLPKILAYLILALCSVTVGLWPILDLSSIANPAYSLLGGMWLALVAALNLTLGYTQWESWKVMVPRFGLPALAGVLPLLYFSVGWSCLLYPLAAAGIGAFYPIREKAFLALFGRERQWFGVQIDSSRGAEFLAGAVILGSMSLFRL